MAGIARAESQRAEPVLRGREVKEEVVMEKDTHGVEAREVTTAIKDMGGLDLREVTMTERDMRGVEVKEATMTERDMHGEERSTTTIVTMTMEKVGESIMENGTTSGMQAGTDAKILRASGATGDNTTLFNSPLFLRVHTILLSLLGRIFLHTPPP